LGSNDRGNGEAGSRSSHGYGDVGGSNSESVDIIGNIVDGLQDVVGINILVATTGHAKGVLGLNPGRVDVLVAEAVLTELVLSVELAGGHGGDGNRGNGGRLGDGDRGGKGGRSNREGSSMGGNLDRGGDKGSRSSTHKGGCRCEGSRGKPSNGSKGGRGKPGYRGNGSRMGNGSSENRGRLDKGSWGSGDERGMNLGHSNEDGSSRDLVITFNGLSLTPLPLNNWDSGSLGSCVGSQMFSTGSSNLRGLHYRDLGSNDRGNGEAGSRSSHGYGDVGGSNSESVDIIGNIVDGLQDVVGINILVATTGHAKGVLGLNPGRVDVLVAEAVLTELVLSVELAGRHGWDSNRGNGGHGGGGDASRLGDGNRRSH